MTELGKFLKETREAKGLSLDDLQQLTKIQKRYLMGIEKGNYEMMPGKFYVRAFIKQYAEAVGLDAEQLFIDYQADIPVAYVPPEENSQKLSRVQSKKTIPVQHSRWMDLLPKILVVVFIVALASIIYYFMAKAIGNDGDSNSVNNNQNNQVTLEENESPPDTNKEEKPQDEKNKDKNKEEEDKNKQEEEAKPELSVKSSDGKNTTYELKNAQDFKLTLKSTGETWISVRDAAGKTIYQGMLVDGKSEELDLSDQDMAKINVGRSTDTEIYVNGEKLEFESDAIVQNITIEFTKE